MSDKIEVVNISARKYSGLLNDIKLLSSLETFGISENWQGYPEAVDECQSFLVSNVEIPSSEDHVYIPKDEYNDLIKKSNLLYCLKKHGVENWENYKFAIEMFREHIED